MQNYSFEKWMFGMSVLLIGLMLTPVQAQASTQNVLMDTAQNPAWWLLALGVNYILIKLFSGSHDGI